MTDLRIASAVAELDALETRLRWHLEELGERIEGDVLGPITVDVEDAVTMLRGLMAQWEHDEVSKR